MKKVRIVMDSTSYLSEDMVKKYNIEVVPLYVRFGEETYKERLDIDDDTFYKRLRGGELSFTSQPSPEDFIKVYKPILDAGNSIISIHISTQMSGTVNSANIAKETLKSDKIYVFDSKFVSLGCGYQVMEIARMLYEEGKSLEDVLKEIPDLYKHSNVYFIVGDLFYLARTGRIGRARAALGTAIRVKPLLYIKDGVVDTFEQPRTAERAKERIIEIVKEKIEQYGMKYMSVIYGDNREEAEEFRKICEKEFNTQLPLVRLGPIVGTNTGPEVLSIHLYTERI